MLAFLYSHRSSFAACLIGWPVENEGECNFKRVPLTYTEKGHVTAVFTVNEVLFVQRAARRKLLHTKAITMNSSVLEVVNALFLRSRTNDAYRITLIYKWIADVKLSRKCRFCRNSLNYFLNRFFIYVQQFDWIHSLHSSSSLKKYYYFA